MLASRRTTRPGRLLGILGSALVHGLGFVTLQWAGTMPKVDFELHLPNEVSFGVTEPSAPQAAAEPAAAPTAEPQAQPSSPTEAAEARQKQKKKREPRDAGVADVEPTIDAAIRATDAGTETTPGDAGAPLLAAFAPEGAQIALRLHMGRIRDTELAADVRMLLDAVPDWRLIVDGSGLDPLRDLERLYIATPDLKRSNLVIAGQYVGGEDVPKRAVENLAAARKVKASWRMRGAIRVAPWANADTTERVLALIAPGQFAITRPDDLPRVLSVARALAQREETAAPNDKQAADALLGLADNETLALAVEGARLFAGGNTLGIPQRLNASVRSAPDGGFDAQFTGHFESASAAQQARDYWITLRDRFASHPLVALIGMRQPLMQAEIRSEDTRLEMHTHVTVQQARVVLGAVSNALRPTSTAQPSGTRAPEAPRPR